MWRLSVLKGVSLIAPSGEPFHTKSHAAKTLMMALALAGEAGLSRDQLAEDLFGSTADASGTLRTLLWRTRSAVARLATVELLETRGDSIRLVNVASDVATLRKAFALSRPRPTDLDEAFTLLAPEVGSDWLADAGESRLIDRLRSGFADEVLSALAVWAQLPQIARWRPQMLRIVGEIQGCLDFNRSTVDRLLRVFGGLGLKELLLTTYDRYETFLQTEYGERAPSDVESLVDDLIRGLDKRHQNEHEVPSADTARLFGREEDLARLARAAETPGVHMLTGRSGIGKSTVLQAFASGPTFSGAKRRWIDLRIEDEDATLTSLLSQAPDAIFIDHYVPSHGPLIEKIRIMLGTARIFVAGISPAGLAATSLLPLGPLEATHGSAPAQRMLEERMRAYGVTSLPSGDVRDELLRFSEGVPYLIDILARLVATAGGEGAVHLLRRTAASDTSHGSWAPLHAVTTASIDALTLRARRALALLARCRTSVTMSALGSDALSPEVLEELVASGLVRVEGEEAHDKTLRVSSSAVAQCTTGIATDEEFAAFVRDLAQSVLSLPLEDLARSEPARAFAQSLVPDLYAVDFRLGVQLLDRLRQFLTAGAVDVLDDGALARYLQDPRLSGDESLSVLLAYGAHLFVAHRFAEMVDLLERHAPAPALMMLSDVQAAGVLSQKGLAYRCVGRYDEAGSLYNSALERARSAGDQPTMAKVSFNLAMLHLQTGADPETGVRLLSSALELLAATPNEAAKVEIMHIRAVLMDDCGAELRLILNELRTALAHASRFGLTRQIAWIVQNMELVYARHDAPELALVCGSSALYLQASLPDGLGREGWRLLRPSLGTIGNCLQHLNLFSHAVTCKSLIDRIKFFEPFLMSQEHMQSLESRTFAGSVSWDEFPVSAEELQHHCRQWFRDTLSKSPELGTFFAELDALSGGQLSKIAEGQLASRSLSG